MRPILRDNPQHPELIATLNRRAHPQPDVRQSVAHIISEIQENQNQALLHFTQTYDQATLTPNTLYVSPDEWASAIHQTPAPLQQSLRCTLHNIHTFAHHSLRQNWTTTNAQGAQIGERYVPYNRIGVYIPGGKAPLISTALMTAGFAQAAGVPEIIAATPCRPDGTINPALLTALHLAGVTQAIKVGGAQAIAALALGTETITPVEKIVGPGNRYVVEAKRQLVGAISIDLLPGPSEILTIADHTANPRFIAADLLAQAEHGPDSLVGLLSPNQHILEQTAQEIQTQLPTLQRQDIIQQALKSAFLLQTTDLPEALTLSNQFAPEHLSLIVENPDQWLPTIHNAGAIYLGNYSAVAVGDFLAGPSHTLPTAGSAKSFSGLRADQFQRRISIVHMDPSAAQCSWPILQPLAQAEGLTAHAHSVQIRTETSPQTNQP